MNVKRYKCIVNDLGPKGQITGVQDCIEGPVLYVMNSRHPAGAIVESGDFRDKHGATILHRVMVRVLGPSTHQAARALANKSSSKHRRLKPGHWHEVFCE